jgi:hypothetical protein
MSIHELATNELGLLEEKELAQAERRRGKDGGERVERGKVSSCINLEIVCYTWVACCATLG